MYKRHLSSHLIQSMKHYPTVTLTGPRQSGKTTLLRNTFPDYKYVLLESPDVLEYATQDPRGFLSQYSTHVIFDEIQNCPSLFSYLQETIDAKDQNGRFILSGSQQFQLNEKISQTLAGRTAIMSLLPLSLSELRATPYQSYWSSGELRDPVAVPKRSLYEHLFAGMYPRLHKNNIPPEKFYRDYVQTYITRDLKYLLNIMDQNKFMTFLRLTAGSCGQRVNLESLGDDAGVDHTTIKRWLSVLETSYIIRLIEPHYKNFNKRLIKAPKIHFLDSGLLCYLLRIRNLSELQNHPLIGGIFESFIFSEIYKSFSHNDEEPPLYYWQDRSKKEIDILIDRGHYVFPVEIKSGKTVTGSQLKNLRYWLDLENNPQESGALIYGGHDYQMRSNIQILPWYEVS